MLILTRVSDDGSPGAAIVLLLSLVLGLGIYFLPTFVGRGKRNLGAIFALNLLLGWTLVGWVVALVWAMTHEEKIVTAPVAIEHGPAVLCSKCGKYSAPTSKFCFACGSAIAA